MANFVASYREIMGIEGFYSFNPADRGGETWKGIARNRNPKWDGWSIIDQLITHAGLSNRTKREKDISSLLVGNPELEQKVQGFYKRNYWDTYDGDGIADQELATEMFDCSVNCGPDQATKWLQKALNGMNREPGSDLLVDGDCGPKTRQRLKSMEKDSLTIRKMINAQQGNHYINLMLKDPSQRAFSRGWIRRV